MGNEMILVFHASLAFMLAIRFGTAERKILVVSLLMLLHLLIITRMVLAPIDSADSILARQHARLQFVIRRELVAVIEIIVVALVSKVIQPTVDVRYHRLGRTLLRLVASTIGSLITRVVIDLGFQLDELKLWIVVTNVAVAVLRIHDLDSKHLLVLLLQQFLDFVASAKKVEVSKQVSGLGKA